MDSDHQHGVGKECPLCEREKVGKDFYDWAKEHDDRIETCEFIQYRFPKSKSQRVRKKWAKNPDNWITIIKVKPKQP